MSVTEFISRHVLLMQRRDPKVLAYFDRFNLNVLVNTCVYIGESIVIDFCVNVNYL